jgi:hypothetical protein
MSLKFEIGFSKSARLSGGLAILLKTLDGKEAAGAAEADPDAIIAKAARIAKFKAKSLRTGARPPGQRSDRMTNVLGPVEVSGKASPSARAKDEEGLTRSARRHGARPGQRARQGRNPRNPRRK